MLLERQDICPNTMDARHNRTPLLLAERGGREGTVRSLFSREDINPITGYHVWPNTTRVRHDAGGCRSNGDAIRTRGYQSRNCGHRLLPNTILVGCAGRPCRNIRGAMEQADLNPDTRLQ